MPVSNIVINYVAATLLYFFIGDYWLQRFGNYLADSRYSHVLKICRLHTYE